MRAFTQKEGGHERQSSSGLTRPGAATADASQRAYEIPHTQRAVENPSAVPPPSQAVRADGEALDAAEPTRFAHDFTSLPVYAGPPPFIQTKLVVGAPGDVYEREADRVSAEVMSMPAGSMSTGAPPQLQRACACDRTCAAERKWTWDEVGESCLQTKSAGPSEAAQTAVPPIVHEVLSTPGQPLDATTRGFMEPRFGHDFSQVRVHADARSSESARAVNALAYTVGHDVVFGAGQYQPHTGAGLHLLAHELSHTIQQGASARRQTRTDSPFAAATAPAHDAPPRLQRALAFEFQTTNLMTTNVLTKEKKPRLFTRKFPDGKSHFHKGASGVELQTDTGSVLEFETRWFVKWSELRAQIQDAADIAAGIAKAPKTFPFSQAAKLKAQGHLGKYENLEVILDDPKFTAAIQSTEGIALTQYGSLLKEHEEKKYAKPTLSHALNILVTGTAAYKKPMANPWIDTLHAFLQVLVNYVIRGQERPSNIGRVSPVKARFRLMHRTNFASMFKEILSPDEQAVFRLIVKNDIIPKELGLSPSDPLFVAGYWGHDPKSGQMVLFQGGVIVAVATEDKEKIHDCSSKTKTPGLDTKSCGRKEPKSQITIGDWLKSVAAGKRDLLSKPYQGSESMGKRNVKTDKADVERGLVVFEVRGYKGRDRTQPASKWVDFAEDVFRQAAACRPRKGTGTELVYDGSKKPFDPKKCPT